MTLIGSSFPSTGSEEDEIPNTEEGCDEDEAPSSVVDLCVKTLLLIGEEVLSCKSLLLCLLTILSTSLVILLSERLLSEV